MRGAAELLGQTPTHLYVRAGLIFAWPKSGGPAVPLAPVLLVNPRAHLVSSEMIFTLSGSGEDAQVTALDGQHALIQPPEGALFQSAAAAPSGAVYVSTVARAGSAGAIYRVRAATRMLELIHSYDGPSSSLQAQDDALYWLRGVVEGDWGDFEVIEHKLGEPGERVVLAAARRQGFLHVFAGKLLVAARDEMTMYFPTMEQYDLGSGVLEKSFPRLQIFPARGSLVTQGERIFIAKREEMQYGPYCPSSGQLFELIEGEGPRAVAGISASTVLADENYFFYTWVFPSCAVHGRPISSGSASLYCARR
jgi:hypothetical protein